MTDSDVKALVIDNGSSVCKAGFAGDEAPRAVFPNIVGTPRHTMAGSMNGLTKDLYVGSEVQTKRGMLSLKYPVENGIVTDWDAMRDVLHHLFHSELRVAPDDYGVMLTEPAINPRWNRDRMAQMLFETFNVPLMYIGVQPVLALYAAGRTTGVVVDCGEGSTTFCPVYEGYALGHAINELDIGGQDLTTYLGKLLARRGYSMLSSSGERDIVREIKESLCYVTLDYTQEKQRTDILNETYELPDGNLINIDEERFKCPEALFDPTLAGKELLGVHRGCYHCIQRCDVDLRKEIYSNIVLSGGSTLFNGFEERLTREVENLVPASTKVKVIAPPERKYSVWIGGAILAGLSMFSQMWVSRQEYEESGPGILTRKMF